MKRFDIVNNLIVASYPKALGSEHQKLLVFDLRKRKAVLQVNVENPDDHLVGYTYLKMGAMDTTDASSRLKDYRIYYSTRSKSDPNIIHMNQLELFEVATLFSDYNVFTKEHIFQDSLANKTEFSFLNEPYQFSARETSLVYGRNIFMNILQPDLN